ncbi:DUF418 domain-containing protein [Cellvibrio fibrivorans]|uniref:DUF418 domain-containing protein n=1 Tax=Cellvibrio fibrivorans TaxID=126350 RepID=A0ABU1UYD9_9GAMM|nr:DUF418 domain-containing protein [Cellvibrio fibrivorans]MDR7090185.1 uncharacterized protein [Cellvibrio fibrivorans]
MTASIPSPHPIHKMDRIVTLDVLRGFALFGILYAHMIFWYAGGPLPQETYQLYKDLGSGIAIGTYMIFILSKFFAIFSFLFGLSFHIQIQGLVQRHEPVLTRFGWRLAILGVIGALHHIFWRADILTIYVPLGFLLLFFRNLSNKTLLIVGSLLVLNIPTKCAELISILLRDQLQLIQEDHKTAGAAYYEIIKNSNFAQMIQHNIHAVTEKLTYQINSGRGFITFGFFLLGMLAGRMQWFVNIDQHQARFKQVLKRSGWILLITVLVGIAFGTTTFALKIDMQNTPFAGWIGGFILEIFNTSLTLIYITGISLLILKPKWEARLSPLASVGKMALSVYLSQSVIGVFLFFNIGLGLFTLTSPGQNALLCIAIFTTQILICRWWLKYFSYGPIEWLWRSATDLKWQPLYNRRVEIKLNKN